MSEKKTTEKTEAIMNFDEAVMLIQTGCIDFNFYNSRGDIMRVNADMHTNFRNITTVEVK
jgi:hypothetical protein